MVLGVVTSDGKKVPLHFFKPVEKVGAEVYYKGPTVHSFAMAEGELALWELCVDPRLCSVSYCKKSAETLQRQFCRFLVSRLLVFVQP